MTSRILAVANQKGGVGKTTIVLGLAAAIANTGRRVLVIDMDQQANASQTLLPDHADLLHAADFYTSNDLLEDGAEPQDLGDAIRASSWENVDVIPGRAELANREVEGALGIEYRLREILSGLDLLDDPYSIVLIDCPPSVGRLTVNAFLAAHEVLLVSHPDSYGQTALDAIDTTLAKVRQVFRHDITIAGIVINMYEDTNEARMRAGLLEGRYGSKVLLTMRKRAVVRTAQGEHRSVFMMTGHPAAREVAGWFTDLARTLRLIGARETVPEMESETSEAAEVRDVEPVAVGY
jgi:chromosome partitioning protein